MIRLAIVEDHPAIAEGLTALLRAESDLTVVGTARDGLAADRLIETQSPDVILCDIRLAGAVDGLQLLAALKASPQWSGLPVVMIAGEGGESKAVEAVKLGAAGYVRQPLTVDQIQQKLAGLL